MKPGQPFEFAWPVAMDHQWINARPFDSARTPKDEEDYLVPLSGMGVALSKPLESATGLFRDFAQLETTQATVRAFANAYGMLGAGTTVVLLNAPQFAVPSIATYTSASQKEGLKMVPMAESLGLWMEQIFTMHRAVQLWDALNSAAPQRELCKFIVWRDETSVMYRFDGSMEWIAATIHHPELLPRLRYPDLVQPAWHQLQRFVNRQLEKFASCPQLLWENGKLPLFIEPQSLIGGLWLQFALAIDGNRQYRTCPGCGRWFEVGGGRKRADAGTCSPTCRQRKNRKPMAKQKDGGRKNRKR